MNKPRQTDWRLLAQSLFKLERLGRHEEALNELSIIWENHDDFPDVEHLSTHDAAEILLRCGALMGFHGQNKLLPNAQEVSANLLTEARRRFIALEDIPKIAECENYLAVAYARRGNYNEAIAWVDEALARDVPDVSNVRISAQLTKSLIFMMAQRFSEVEEYLRPLEPNFRRLRDEFLIGSFCTNLSVALGRLGKTPESLRYLESARLHHQKSGHLVYLGTVENNLANAYAKLGRFADARATIDSAIKIFRRASDRAREGFAFDTKGQILLKEKSYGEALEAVEKAIDILGNSEIVSFTVEAYVTKAKILHRLKGSTAALMCLSEAIQMARTHISDEHALALVKEFEDSIEAANEQQDVVASAEGTGSLELVLHPTIAHYREYHGVWIKNDHLAGYGIPQGSLAVACRDELRRGDLAAITERATGEVVCGFYDNEFGIVCLEGVGDEPVIFNETEVEILGKIVGVGSQGRGPDGKIRVEPVRL